jgi:hypothetical protein
MLWRTILHNIYSSAHWLTPPCRIGAYHLKRIDTRRMVVNSGVLWGLCIGFLGISVTGLASADGVSEYTSSASWSTAVNKVSDYGFSGAVGELTPFISVAFGPGTFTTGEGFGLLYNDGQYGTGVQYVSDDPAAFGGGSQLASVTVSFSAAADVTALAFTLGADSAASTVDVSVNGSALGPLAVSPAFPTTFFGATDTSGPITSITFTSLNFGEMDVIGSYSTASAVTKAPEVDPASATSMLTLLFGGLAVLRGRKRA